MFAWSILMDSAKNLFQETASLADDIKQKNLKKISHELKSKIGSLSSQHKDILNKLISLKDQKESSEKLTSYVVSKINQGEFHLFAELIYHSRHLKLKDDFGKTYNFGKFIRKIIEEDLDDVWKKVLADDKLSLLQHEDFKEYKIAIQTAESIKKQNLSKGLKHTTFEVLCHIYYGFATSLFKRISISLKEIEIALRSKPLKMPREDYIALSMRIPDLRFSLRLQLTLSFIEIHISPIMQSSQSEGGIKELLTMLPSKLAWSFEKLKDALLIGNHFAASIPMSETLDFMTDYQEQLNPLKSKEEFLRGKDWYKRKVPQLIRIAQLYADRYPGVGDEKLSDLYFRLARFYKEDAQGFLNCYDKTRLVCDKYKIYLILGFYHLTLASKLIPKLQNLVFFTYVGNIHLRQNADLRTKNEKTAIKNLKILSILTQEKIELLQEHAENKAAEIIGGFTL